MYEINKYKKELYIVLLNLYLIFSTFIFIPFIFFKEFSDHYQRYFLINFNYKTVIYFFLFLLLLNLFYLLFTKLSFNKKLRVGIQNNININLIAIIAISFVYIFNAFIKDFDFQINHLTNLLIIYTFFYLYLLKNFKFKLIICLFTISYFIYILLYKSIAFNSVFILSLTTIILLKSNLSLKKLIFFCIIIFIILFILLSISSQIKRDGIMSFADSTVLRISNFHIINRIIDRTPECDNDLYLDKETSYEISKKIMNDNNFKDIYIKDFKDLIINSSTVDLKKLYEYEKKIKNKIKSQNLKDYLISWSNINSNNELILLNEVVWNPKEHGTFDDFVRTNFDYFNREHCRSSQFLLGKYYNEPLSNLFKGTKFFKTDLKNFGNRFARNYGFQSINSFSTGVGTTILGDGYINFGIYGIILNALIISLILVFIRNLYVKSHHLVISTYLFALLVLAYETTLLESLLLLSKFFILILIIFFIERIFYKKYNNFKT